ncbi:hypothetical protein [Mesorhizobium sp. M0323]|uniref:hypothetical protein n=1 Tax=Mesorhizobium sp. M0323 TaxID=2956938 RepID=UPI0033358546
MDETTPTVVELDDEEEEGDSPFNAYRFAASEYSKGIIQEDIGLLLNSETHFGLRTNKRRDRDQQTFDLSVDAVLSDVMHHHLAEHLGDIYVTRSNRVLGTKSRYRPRAYSKIFEAKDGSADRCAGGRGCKGDGHPARSPACDRMADHGVGIEYLDEHPHGETIVLKRVKDREDCWDEGGSEEYDDTPDTERHRAEPVLPKA